MTPTYRSVFRELADGADTLIERLTHAVYFLSVVKTILSGIADGNSPQDVIDSMTVDPTPVNSTPV